nr:hypothetical protein BaRGS_031251 [Batillaria attramentaria]
MRSRGEQLMMEDQYAVDSIRPKCVELQRMCEQYKDLLRRRRQLLTKSHDLHDRLDRFRPDIRHNVPSVAHDSSSSSKTSSVSMNSVAVSDTSSDIPMASDGTQRSSLSSMSLSSLPEMDILQAKRRHVMNELIETEKAYVTELQEILKGYYKEMDSRTMQHLIPQELTGQKHALFGNLEQIYKFHHE